MRELGFHFLPSVCIRLLFSADSILQLFHFVGFYGRIDFLSWIFFFFFGTRRAGSQINVIPRFPSLCCEGHCKRPDKDKKQLNPLCSQTNQPSLALMTLCDHFIFPWLGWHSVALLAMPQPCSGDCKDASNLPLKSFLF